MRDYYSVLQSQFPLQFIVQKVSDSRSRQIALLRLSMRGIAMIYAAIEPPFVDEQNNQLVAKGFILDANRTMIVDRFRGAGTLGTDFVSRIFLT